MNQILSDIIEATKSRTLTDAERLVLTNYIKAVGGKKDKTIPTEGEFVEYALSVLKSQGIGLSGWAFVLQSKYQSFVDNDWKDGFNVPIKNWKTKIRNLIPHMKPLHVPNQTEAPKSTISYK